MNNFIDQCEYFPFELIKWYKDHQRKLPWRDTKDPYKIWLSEIILQQTRVNQGLKYYEKFVDKYPEVADLAEAKEEAVLKDWQGLGYYSRARNLHQSAKTIQHQYEGVFPDTYAEIKKLKGVGDYTAAAIASFAFDEAKAVIDGNVYRLLSRYFGMGKAIDSPEGQAEIRKLAETLIPLQQAAEYNQAIMEFGALQCTPKNPLCSECPLQSSCFAFAEKKVDQLPLKIKKTKVRDRYFNYLIIELEDRVYLHHRREKGIWQNLYDFPLIESKKTLSSKKLTETENFKEWLTGVDYRIEHRSKGFEHLLSHQRIKAHFIHLKVSKPLKFPRAEFQLIKVNQIGQYPVPKLIENYLGKETNLLSLFKN